MSKTLFRLALEDGETQPADQKEIVMQGPLAEVYAKALDVVYAKPDALTDETVFGGDKNQDANEPTANSTEAAADKAHDAGGVAATDQTGTDIVAQETQANDALTAQAVAAQSAPREEAPSADITIYGVSQVDVTEGTVSEVTKQITERKPGSEYILILDATQPGPNGSVGAGGERAIDLNAALETVASCLGAKVYPSLEAYCESNGVVLRSTETI
ncbi:hypothetical protein D3C71_78700 [compost metagenome]